ncbi:protocadherin-23-like [Convolutriloba macropyga]|uniref:protocadherin-23-like n=1 Tax=Convolutriloba macropyga TaxID=536237 RepID=UPI003F51FDB5
MENLFQDVNDISPQFAKSFYTTSVFESMAVGTTILQVSASDEDTSDKYKKIFYAISNSEVAWFRMDSQLGRLELAAKMDAELMQNVTLEDQSNISVIVLDSNDRPPVFEQDKYTTTVSEASEVGSVMFPVGVIRALDSDISQLPVEYSLFNHLTVPISIDPSTAKVTLSGILDFEKSGGRYEFVVIATDVTEPFLSGQAILEILVTDSNDQPPIFALSEYFFSVYENSPNGTLVGKLTASDGDSINLDFSLLENSNFFPFIIDTSTGDIYTTDSIDRETNGGFLFEAVVSDGNTFMTVNVTVEILDLNDKNPRSPETIYSFIIPELQAKGFEVGVIPASDDDATVPNNLVGFRIVAGNFDSAFAIEIYSGVISVNDQDAANIMVHPVFDLTVQIYDFGEPSLSSLVDVVITLTDVNNNLPSFPEELYEATIPEDLPTPSLVIQVEAVDLDVAADLTYNFITPVANFMIDQSNGRILVASELDAETRSEYSFTVQVDDGTHVARTSVVVHVSDVNDNAPLFLSNFTNISVSETASIGEVVGKVEAIDIDSDANGIIYSFSEGSSYFAIQSTTGDIFVAQNLETRPENFFQMIVTALDVTPPSDKETEFSFLIEVIDSSKNAPTFNTDIIELSIPEDFAENSTIFVLNATDADDGLGGEIEYTIIGQSDDEFQIDQSNLIFTGQLDYEVQSYYSVIVRAQDFGEVPLSTDVRIIISVENVNDNSPEILNLPAKSLYIPSKNYFFFQVICEDRDINRYDSIGKIEFGLENLVVASDGEFSTSISVFVLIESFVDGGPQFVQSQYTLILPENMPAGTKILTFASIYNPDFPVEYEIVSQTAAVFQVGAGNGVLRVSDNVNEADLFDHELFTEIMVVVQVSQPQASPDLANLLVKVTDLNDNAPVFTITPGQNLKFTETEQIVVQYEIVDADSGLNAEADFIFVTDPSGITSLISSSNGKLVFAPVDFEALYAEINSSTGNTMRIFDIVVTASDQGTPKLSQTTAVNVVITNENDNSPFWFKFPSEDTLIVTENFESTTQSVFQFVAKDNDDADKIVYSIREEKPLTDHFRIEAESGELYVVKQLNREQYLNVADENQPKITVEASDGTNILVSLLKISIQVVTPIIV